MSHSCGKIVHKRSEEQVNLGMMILYHVNIKTDTNLVRKLRVFSKLKEQKLFPKLKDFPNFSRVFQRFGPQTDLSNHDICRSYPRYRWVVVGARPTIWKHLFPTVFGPEDGFGVRTSCGRQSERKSQKTETAQTAS